jgi:hypothetical protein
MTNLIRAAVYAGIAYNGLTILIFVFNHDYDNVILRSFNLAIWTGVYLLHRWKGTW